jgi:hypothetical protein
VVDGLAITGLHQTLIGQQQRWENNLEAESILRAAQRGLDTGTSEAARDHLARSGRQIDPQLRDQLLDLIAKAWEV